GGHLYAEEGQPTISVAISHDSAVIATAESMAQIADTPLAPKGGFTLSAVEGLSSSVGTMATFTDPGGNETLAEYSAQIAWGDGTTTPGTIGFDNLRRIYTVTGVHTYAEEGQQI